MLSLSIGPLETCDFHIDEQFPCATINDPHVAQAPGLRTLVGNSRSLARPPASALARRYLHPLGLNKMWY